MTTFNRQKDIDALVTETEHGLTILADTPPRDLKIRHFSFGHYTEGSRITDDDCFKQMTRELRKYRREAHGATTIHWVQKPEFGMQPGAVSGRNITTFKAALAIYAPSLAKAEGQLAFV